MPAKWSLWYPDDMAMPNFNLWCSSRAESTAKSAMQLQAKVAAAANPARRQAVGTRVKGDGKLTYCKRSTWRSQPSGESTTFTGSAVCRSFPSFRPHPHIKAPRRSLGQVNPWRCHFLCFALLASLLGLHRDRTHTGTVMLLLPSKSYSSSTTAYTC